MDLTCRSETEIRISQLKDINSFKWKNYPKDRSAFSDLENSPKIRGKQLTPKGTKFTNQQPQPNYLIY